MRVDGARGVPIDTIPVLPELTISAAARVRSSLEEWFPGVEILAPGFFLARWEGGGRFLEVSLRSAGRSLSSLGFPAAWGLAAEQAVAEVAARIARPGEVKRVPRGEVRGFLAPLPLELLPDLRGQPLRMLRDIGTTTFGELAELPPEVLRALFGHEGLSLLRLAREGERPRLTGEWRGRFRFPGDTDMMSRAADALADLVAGGVEAVNREGRKITRLSLTLLYADGRRATGSRYAPGAEHEGRWLRLALELLAATWRRRVRIIELRIALRHEFRGFAQLGLFTRGRHDVQVEQLARAVRGLRRRWGRRIVRYASACAAG